jgi:hypothetical protein
MKHLRYWTLSLFALAVILLSSSACGPDFPTAVFVLPDAPDGNYAAFAAGHLGVLQPGFHSRSLAIAYLVLSGRHLDAAAQQQAVAANQHFVDPSSDSSNLSDDKPLPGFDAWVKTRAAFSPVASPADKPDTDRHLPGEDYTEFTNCLDNAFATAAATLTARTQQHGPQDPSVAEWVRGQDAVFSNCGDGIAPRYFGSGQAPPPPPAPHPPTTVVNVPLWLQQDRAYQLAAAQFYAMHYDDALASFRAIAADTASPWSITARYLEARTLIRKAELAPLPDVHNLDGAPMTAEQRQAHEQLRQQQRKAAELQAKVLLQQAQQELLAMQSEPRMAPLHNAVDDLIDYVDLRLAPDAQTVTLAQRLLTPPTPRLKQTLIDFTALHTAGSASEVSIGPLTPAAIAARKALFQQDAASTNPSVHAAAELNLWVDALNNNDANAALAHWHTTPSTPWLVAALLFAKPADADAPALIAAAQAIPTTNPAWLTVTYHRLRLSPPTDARRNELITLLHQFQKTEGTSTLNLFTALAAASSTTLDAWLSHAARTPAGEDSDEDTDVQLIAQPTGGTAVDVCGHPEKTTQPLFDTDDAVALNQQFPLRLLATAAESSTLPANLRYQVAQATLVRSILLDQPALANRMAPILEGCRPAWKPVLDAYAAASTPSDRHAAGLLALMRFASTEPSVREGEERRQGFATYDELRQNWWCSTVPRPTETVDSAPLGWFPDRDPDAPYGSDPATMTTHPHIVPPPPAFLTPADLAEAHTEAAALRAVPNASTYFANQALNWFRDHPRDPRDADILGEADRVLRNACRHDPPYGKPPTPDSTVTLAHQVFDTLHQNFPESAWAKRYKTWE